MKTTLIKNAVLCIAVMVLIVLSWSQIASATWTTQWGGAPGSGSAILGIATEYDSSTYPSTIFQGSSGMSEDSTGTMTMGEGGSFIYSSPDYSFSAYHLSASWPEVGISGSVWVGAFLSLHNDGDSVFHEEWTQQVHTTATGGLPATIYFAGEVRTVDNTYPSDNKHDISNYAYYLMDSGGNGGGEVPEPATIISSLLGLFGFAARKAIGRKIRI